MYFKGALFLNTLRSVVNDDARWWKLLRDFFQHFKYQNIMTEDVVQFFNAQLGQNLTPVFDQYLRRADLPTLELAFNEAEGTVAYRWKADERDVRHADPGRRARQVDHHPADDRLGGDEDAAEEGRLRGRDRPLLRQRHETVGGRLSNFGRCPATNGHKERVMKYLCLIYDEEKKLDAMPKAEGDAFMGEYFGFTEGIKKTGHYLGGNALQPVQTATTVRVRNGKVSTTDGPFAETRSSWAATT